eukprot:13500580-Ditylum_brightwellii.AAC.1
MQIRWMKGHQDEDKTKNELTWQVILNIRADKLATKAQHKITDKQRKERIDLLPVCYVHLIIDRLPITNNVTERIREKWCSIKNGMLWDKCITQETITNANSQQGTYTTGCQLETPAEQQSQMGNAHAVHRAKKH